MSGWDSVEAPTKSEISATFDKYDKGGGSGWEKTLDGFEVKDWISAFGIKPDVPATEEQIGNFFSAQGFSDDAVKGILANARDIWPGGPPTGEDLLSTYKKYAGWDKELSKSELADANSELLKAGGYTGYTGPGGEDNGWGGSGNGWGDDGWGNNGWDKPNNWDNNGW